MSTDYSHTIYMYLIDQSLMITSLMVRTAGSHGSAMYDVTQAQSLQLDLILEPS